MEKSNLKLVLKFAEDGQIPCSRNLLIHSQMLQQMIQFSDDSDEEILCPRFLSKPTILQIIKLLDCEKNVIQDLLTSSIKYLITILLRATDFLAIESLTIKINSIIKQRLIPSNCFEIYSMSKEYSYMDSVSTESLKLIMLQINNFYTMKNICESITDPFCNDYKDFSIFEIKKMLTIDKKIKTLSKIMCFKNWWQRNVDLQHKSTVIEILENINSSAMYIPRREIIFMRSIRDNIIEHMENIKEITDIDTI